MLFFGLDFIFTKLIGSSGFSKFFEEDSNVVYINKRNFKGKFCGPLDDY